MSADEQPTLDPFQFKSFKIEITNPATGPDPRLATFARGMAR